MFCSAHKTQVGLGPAILPKSLCLKEFATEKSNKTYYPPSPLKFVPPLLILKY